MTPGFLDVKNSRNVARWAWRWHKQNGSRFWVAHDLMDLRDEEGLRRWREIEGKRRRLSKRVRKIVNLAAWRFERVRRKRRLQATA